jgi:hypothetical protein
VDPYLLNAVRRESAVGWGGVRSWGNVFLWLEFRCISVLLSVSLVAMYYEDSSSAIIRVIKPVRFRSGEYVEYMDERMDTKKL